MAKGQRTHTAVLLTAGDKQKTIEEAVNFFLESEQASDAYPGNCTPHNTEDICTHSQYERTAPQLPSMDYCAEPKRLMLFNWGQPLWDELVLMSPGIQGFPS